MIIYILRWIDNLSGGFARIDNGKPREFTEYVTTGELESRIQASGYDAETGTYLYSEYGTDHIDPENNNKQLAFTNVILQCADD